MTGFAFCYKPDIRSNRTFMELKFRQAMSDQHPPLVLIVPLWN